MSAHCQVTGRKRGFGKAVSHARRRTKRRFDPNIEFQRHRLPGEDRCVRLALSATRVRDRDVIDGRPRAYHRAFGLSRVNLPQQAHAGFLPGVRKSSW